MTIAAQVARIAADAREASLAMARLSTTAKNDMLLAMAAELQGQAAHLVAENARDLEAGTQKGLSAAMLDRLMLDEKRIAGIADALREVAALPDPVGEVTGMRILPTIRSLGRFHIPVTSPTGSGRAATSRRASAMPAMRCSSSISRSSMAAESPFRAPSSRSPAFSAISCGACA